MANEEHLRILKKGVAEWNVWRDANPEICPDLHGADLSEANLSWANLHRANLHEANLSWANLMEADLRAANLIMAVIPGANLMAADLGGADLHGANLSAARLAAANLNWANLRAANLDGAHLDEAELYGTVFADVDLSMTRGLATVHHIGPSTISIDTIYRSGGKIPEAFLRGAGVPDAFITYMASLVGQPIQFYSCFISHSSQDKQFCARLYADLQARHVRTWYFPEDARWGEPVWGEIDHSIQGYDKLVVVCSKNSLQSGPVLREIARALNREDREGQSVLFPIRIDDYIFKHWAHPRQADVLAKVVGDFSGWARSPEHYDKAFERLLRALQASEKPAGNGASAAR